MKNLFLILFLFLTCNLFAQEIPLPPLRSTEEILKLANRSRIDFSDAVSEIRNSAMERRSLSVNLEYLMLLTKFKEIEVFHQFPEFGISPTGELGDYLTGTISLKAKIDDLNDEQIKQFVRWSVTETLVYFLDMQSQYIGKKDTGANNWIERFNKSILIIQEHDKLPKTDSKSMGALYSLPGFLLGQFFLNHSQEIDLKTFFALLQKNPNAEALDNLLQIVTNQWPLLTSNETKIKFLYFTLAIAQRSLEIAPNFSPRPSLGEIFSFQIQDLLSTNSRLDLNEVEKALAFLSFKDWEDFNAKILSIQPKEIAIEQIPFFTYIYDKIISERAQNLVKAEINKIISNKKQIQVSELQSEQLADGLYEIKIANKDYRLWIIRQSPWQINAALLSEQGDKISTFEKSEYNPQTNELVLSNASDLSIPEGQIRININKTNKTKLTGKMVTNSEQKPFELELLSLLKSGPNAIHKIVNGIFSQTSGNITYALELTQLGKLDWTASLKISKGSNQSAKINLTTSTSCFSTSNGCALIPEVENEDMFISARMTAISETEVNLILIRGLSVINLNLKR